MWLYIGLIVGWCAMCFQPSHYKPALDDIVLDLFLLDFWLLLALATVYGYDI